MAGPYEGFYPGTTSACAENTVKRPRKRKSEWNYLRVRGEYDRNYPTCGVFPELPPRARRIRQVRFRNIPNDGTTSACAENTFGAELRNLASGNYLRVRGEYVKSSSSSSLNQELPPRARRILVRTMTNIKNQGTTSACAENTPNGWKRRFCCMNYLRVRGEYPK